MILRTALPISLAVLSLACASSQPGNRRSTTDRNTITQEQIREHHFNNAYDAVAALHAGWLQLRGADSFMTPGEILVYYDNARMGGTETLRAISANSIAFIRFYDANAATSRWGVGHANGVIFVSSRIDAAK